MALACTLMVGFLFTGCGSGGGEKKVKGEKEGTVKEAPSKKNSKADEAADKTAPKAKDALKELEEIVKWGEDFKKKADNKEITGTEALGYLVQFVEKASNYEKEYGSLTEDDFSPRQYKRYQELKARLKELVDN